MVIEPLFVNEKAPRISLPVVNVMVPLLMRAPPIVKRVVVIVRVPPESIVKGLVSVKLPPDVRVPPLSTVTLAAVWFAASVILFPV